MSETLVVTDLDGTFWDLAMEIHPETLAAVAELDRRGIPLLIATGRRLATAQAGFAASNFWRPTIVLNGTLGVDFGKVEGIDDAAEAPVFHTAPFSADDAHAVIDSFANFGHNPCTYAGDGRVHVGPEATTGPRHRAEMNAEIGDEDPRVLADSGDVLGFSIIGVGLEGLDGLAPQLQGLGLLVDIFQDPVYGGFSIMAQPPGVSKQSGIEAFISYAGIENPRVIAVGDGGNDLQMLEAADLGVGVSGGDPAVLAMADRLIPHPSEGGWAQLIDMI